LAFASEIGTLQLKNPNLDFDVAAVPISRDGGTNVSFANFDALAITKSSKNPNAAYYVISILSGADGDAAWSEVFEIASGAPRSLEAKSRLMLMKVFSTIAP